MSSGNPLDGGMVARPRVERSSGDYKLPSEILEDWLYNCFVDKYRNVRKAVVAGSQQCGKTWFCFALLQILLGRFGKENVDIKIVDPDKTNLRPEYKVKANTPEEILEELMEFTINSRKKVIVLCISDAGRMFSSSQYNGVELKRALDKFFYDFLTKIRWMIWDGCVCVYVFIGVQESAMLSPRMMGQFNTFFFKSSPPQTRKNDMIMAGKNEDFVYGLLEELDQRVGKDPSWVVGIYPEEYGVKLFAMDLPTYFIDPNRKKEPQPEIPKVPQEEELRIVDKRHIVKNRVYAVLRSLLVNGGSATELKAGYRDRNGDPLQRNQQTVYFQKDLFLVAKAVLPLIRPMTGENSIDQQTEPAAEEEEAPEDQKGEYERKLREIISPGEVGEK